MKNLLKRPICASSIPTFTTEYGWIFKDGQSVFAAVGEIDDFAEIQKGLETCDDTYLRRLSEAYNGGLAAFGERLNINDLNEAQALALDMQDYLSTLDKSDLNSFIHDPLSYLNNVANYDKFNYQDFKSAAETADKNVDPAEEKEG